MPPNPRRPHPRDPHPRGPTRGLGWPHRGFEEAGLFPSSCSSLFFESVSGGDVAEVWKLGVGFADSHPQSSGGARGSPWS